jgi:hypothetical protein
MKGWKWQDCNIQDQNAGVENAGLENARVSLWDGKNRTKCMKRQALFEVITLNRNKQQSSF